MNKFPQVQRKLEGHRKPITDVAFSPTNAASAFSPHSKRPQQLLASSSLDGMITLWSFPHHQFIGDEQLTRTKRAENVRAYR